MELFGTKGQKFLHCIATKGQWDNVKILPRDGTVRDNLSKSGTGLETGQYEILTACSVPSHGTKQDRAENDVLKQEKDVLKQKRKY